MTRPFSYVASVVAYLGYWRRTWRPIRRFSSSPYSGRMSRKVMPVVWYALTTCRSSWSWSRGRLLYWDGR